QRRAADELNLKLSTSPGGLWPDACDLSSDAQEERQLGLAWHKKQVDLTAALGGIAYTGALYGHPGTVKRRIPPSDEWTWTAEGLHNLAAYAARAGVAIVLEPMSHFRTHLINTPTQLAKLIQLAGHPNLHALIDTYHIVTEVRDYAEAFKAVRNMLWGVHACENDRGVPGGGLVPWDAIFNALSSMAFDGYMLFETYNSTVGYPPGSFAYQRGMFHNPCPDGENFIRQGLSFLKKKASQYRIG
ncbi:MAG: sugar phosphate isomerase/epimerase, partial [Anaerolineae bacterium]|nr:sugar phosphate isomerase/epimerase [Anaerolineae bacterium]